MIHVLKPCAKEILKFPQEIRDEIMDLLSKLEEGDSLSMPVSRPMPIIGRGVHELRLKDGSGQYRVIYFLLDEELIYILTAFRKKSEQTPFREIQVAKARLKGISR